jgi:CubicO group peptidase (beta-lactamase class C family)
VPTPGAPSWNRAFAEWEKQIPQWLQAAKLPGIAMVMIDDGKIFWRRDFGLKDAVSREPVAKDTVFAACSNTKPVFAYAMVNLCEKGVLDLNTPLTKYTSRRFLEGEYRLPPCPSQTRWTSSQRAAEGSNA